MLKRAVILCLLAFPALSLRADAIADALATAKQLQARISAATEFQSPSLSNIQNASGDAASLKSLADNLVKELSGLDILPSDVQSASLSVDTRITTIQGTNYVVNASAMISACRDLGSQLNSLQGMLPGVIASLQAQQGNAINLAKTAVYMAPTAVPGPADAGQVAPTATPYVSVVFPTPVPTAQGVAAGGSSLPPVGNPGLLPGGPSLPPPAPPTPVPPRPQSTPTPQSALKAPMAMLSVGGGDDDRGGKVYVANYNAGNVAVLSTDLKRVTAFIAVGSQPVAMANADSMAVVANFGSGSISLIDTSKDTVVATVTVGSQPIDVAVAEGKAFVVNQGSNSVSIVDLVRHSVVKTLSIGLQPSRIALRSGRAYVSDTNEDSIAIIDTHFNDLVATVSE